MNQVVTKKQQQGSALNMIKNFFSNEIAGNISFNGSDKSSKDQ